MQREKLENCEDCGGSGCVRYSDDAGAIRMKDCPTCDHTGKMPPGKIYRLQNSGGWSDGIVRDDRCSSAVFHSANRKRLTLYREVHGGGRLYWVIRRGATQVAFGKTYEEVAAKCRNLLDGGVL